MPFWGDEESLHLFDIGEFNLLVWLVGVKVDGVIVECLLMGDEESLHLFDNGESNLLVWLVGVKVDGVIVECLLIGDDDCRNDLCSPRG